MSSSVAGDQLPYGLCVLGIEVYPKSQNDEPLMTFSPARTTFAVLLDPVLYEYQSFSSNTLQ